MISSRSTNMFLQLWICSLCVFISTFMYRCQSFKIDLLQVFARVFFSSFNVKNWDMPVPFCFFAQFFFSCNVENSDLPIPICWSSGWYFPKKFSYVEKKRNMWTPCLSILTPVSFLCTSCLAGCVRAGCLSVSVSVVLYLRSLSLLWDCWIGKVTDQAEKSLPSLNQVQYNTVYYCKFMLLHDLWWRRFAE
jgi:hypothetical protein